MHLLRKHTARLRPVRLFMWDERNGFDMTILVIDGQGGKLGKRLVESIKKSFPQVEVMAVGTNSAASESMMRAGADRVATGENPVIVASRTAQIIVGPMGIALADALMGEISPAMANAVAASAAYRVLIPMNLCDTYVAGVSQKSSAIMDDAMEHIRQLLTEMGDTACSISHLRQQLANMLHRVIHDGRRFLADACHIGVAEIHGDQHPVGCAGSNGIGHCRRDLSHQRVGKGYPHRANDDLGSPAGNNDRVFTGRHPVRTGTHHAL